MFRCTPSHTPSHIAVVTLVLALGVGLLAGCSGKPENSPVIRRKFKEFDVVKEESKAAEQQIAQMSVEISILKDQVENLRALVPDAQGKVSAVSRIEKIEARLAGVENDAVRSITSTSARNAAPAPAEETVQTSTRNPLIDSPKTVEVPAVRRERGLARPEKAEEKESAPAPATRTAPSESSKPSQTVAQASIRTSAAPAAPKKAASRGSYYELKPGDTLESIAKANGLTVDAIKKENRLPSGARLLAGQRLYLPPRN
ncbi:MAG: LysM peptidoglycan-binding domain-containing protein [Sumerlaeia bacterium]